MKRAFVIGGDTDEVQGNIAEKKEAYRAALKDECQGMMEFYKDKHYETLFDNLTVFRDTPLHIAAHKGCTKLLHDLLQMVPRTRIREILTRKDLHGNTPLHEVATSDNVEAAQLLVRKLLGLEDGKVSIQEKHIREREELLRVRNNLGETPLYRAAACGKKQMLEYLVEEVEKVGDIREHYHRDDLISILHIAVIGQHFDTALWLLKRDEKLALMKEQSGLTCFQLLAGMPNAFESSCSRDGLQAVIYFFLPSLSADSGNDDELNELPLRKREDIESGGLTSYVKKSLRQSIPYEVILCMYRVFWRFLAQAWDMIDETLKLKQKHELAKKLAEKLVKIDKSWVITHEIWDSTVCIEEGGEEMGLASKLSQSMKKKSSVPGTPLLIAARNGIQEIVKGILNMFPQAIDHVSRNGQNLLHVVILHRQLEIFESLVNKETEVGKLAAVIDSNGNSILHCAADTSYYRGGTRPGAAFQLQEELWWFEKVKKVIPSHYEMHRNRQGLTADELFKKMHKDQYNEAKKWISNIAQSCSAVAALVASVVFAAAFGVPGGFRGEAKNGPGEAGSKQENLEGLPVLMDKPLYKLFTVMDVASLASSQTSLILFLSILTSSTEEKDFFRSLPRRLTLAFNCLFFSVTTAMITFTSTILLTVQPKNEMIKTLNYVAASLPIALFVIAQYRLYAAFSTTVMDILKGLYSILIPQKCMVLVDRLCSKFSPLD